MRPVVAAYFVYGMELRPTDRPTDRPTVDQILWSKFCGPNLVVQILGAKFGWHRRVHPEGPPPKFSKKVQNEFLTPNLGGIEGYTQRVPHPIFWKFQILDFHWNFQLEFPIGNCQLAIPSGNSDWNFQFLFPQFWDHRSP